VQEINSLDPFLENMKSPSLCYTEELEKTFSYYLSLSLLILLLKVIICFVMLEAKICSSVKSCCYCVSVHLINYPSMALEMSWSEIILSTEYLYHQSNTL